MSAQSKTTILTGLYTLTPTHCGTGQTRGAVDLPIARETHTSFPVIPATSVKGVARDRYGVAKDKEVERLFGPDTESAGDLKAGELILTEGKLLAFPVRSLNRPFFYVTCSLILERFERDLRAFGLESFLPPAWSAWSVKHVPDSVARISHDLPSKDQALVIEDLVYEQVQREPALGELAQALGKMLPAGEKATQGRLQRSLLLLPDEDFKLLVNRMPVVARTKLTSGKTTGPFINFDNKKETGNLWYEEVLPADCLFALFVSERQPGAVAEFQKHMAALSPLQIGGNETVGQGLCWWTRGQGA